MENKLSKIPEINTITDIVVKSAELPTIRNADQNEVNSAIMSTIIEVFNMYNETLNDIQAKLLFPTAKETLQGLTIPDILIFKNKCLKGEYSKKFRLTPDVFIDWIKEYKFERMEAFENFNLSRKKQIEAEPLKVGEGFPISEGLKILAKNFVPKEEIKPTPIPNIGYHKAIKDYQMYLSAKFDEIAIKDKEDDRGNAIPPHIEVANKPLLKMDWVNLEYSKTYESIREKYESAENISFEDFYTTELNKITNGKV